MTEEWFPRVDVEGRVIGRVARSEAHGHPELIHPVVHCLVVTPGGQLVLQLRSKHKDVEPLRWDTSVGGHVDYGEAVEEALVREIREELGLSVDLSETAFLYRWIQRSPVETELVHSFRLVHAGPFRRHPDEIERLELFDSTKIATSLGTGYFTASFEAEYSRYLAWQRNMPSGSCSPLP